MREFRVISYLIPHFTARYQGIWLNIDYFEPCTACNFRQRLFFRLARDVSAGRDYFSTYIACKYPAETIFSTYTACKYPAETIFSTYTACKYSAETISRLTPRASTRQRLFSMLHLMQPSEIIDFLLLAYYVIHGIKDFGIATTVTKSWSISIPPFYIYI